MVAAWLLISACSAPSRPCTAATCLGCCDSTGDCRVGSEQLACGMGGAACSSCSLGQTCTLGACALGTGQGGGNASGGGGGATGGGGGLTGGGRGGGAGGGAITGGGGGETGGGRGGGIGGGTGGGGGSSGTGTLLVLANNSNASREELLRVDIGSGNATFLATYPVQTVTSAWTIDRARNTAYFVGSNNGTNGPWLLHGVSTRTGALLQSPVIGLGVMRLFVRSDGQLICVTSATSGWSLDLVDPSSGARAPISSIPGGWDDFAFDPRTNRLYMVETPGMPVLPLYLITLDAMTGAVLNRVQLALTPQGNGYRWAGGLYVRQDSVLVGLHQDTGLELDAIDPNTGAVTLISTVPGISYISRHAFVGDPRVDRAYLTGLAQPPTGPTPSQLFTVDLRTGAIISAPVLPGSPNVAYRDALFVP
jgi:hypothetical protein